MDKLKLDIVGGMPLKLDDLLWQNGDLDAVNWGLVDGIQSQLLAYGTDFIVEGCTYAAPNITAGWIMLDSELMRVDAHAGTDDFFVKTITFDARGLKTFKNTTVNNTYEKNRGVLSGASGSLNITTALRLEDKIIQLLATSTQQLAVANIPNLPASKTTSGAFDTARIPSLATTKITSGVFVEARLPLSTTSLKGIVEKATAAELLAKTADKFVDALLLNTHETWQTPSYESGYVAGTVPLQFRRLSNGQLQISGSISLSSPAGQTISTLAAAYRPTTIKSIIAKEDAGTIVMVILESDGSLGLPNGSASPTALIFIDIIIPLDK